MIANRRRFRRLYLAEGLEREERLDEILELAGTHALDVARVPRTRLDEMVGVNHHGVLLETSLYPYADEYDLEELAAARAIVLALDSIVDPQNVGTLLRTAEATGVRLVVIPSDRAAAITPSVVNASSGAVEHLRIVEEINLTRFLNRAKDAGFWVAGLAGDEGAQPLFDSRMSPPIVLVVGSEGSGLRRLVREACDLVVSLPMAGRVESLNAAVAGSIALYEVVRDAEDLGETGRET